MKALEILDGIAKDFNIDESKRVTPQEQYMHVRAQEDEMKAILNRLLFDASMAKIKLANATDSDAKSAHTDSLNRFLNDIRQFTVNLTLVQTFKDELVERHKELGQTSRNSTK